MGMTRRKFIGDALKVIYSATLSTYIPFSPLESYAISGEDTKSKFLEEYHKIKSINYPKDLDRIDRHLERLADHIHRRLKSGDVAYEEFDFLLSKYADAVNHAIKLIEKYDDDFDGTPISYIIGKISPASLSIYDNMILEVDDAFIHTETLLYNIYYAIYNAIKIPFEELVYRVSNISDIEFVKGPLKITYKMVKRLEAEDKKFMARYHNTKSLYNHFKKYMNILNSAEREYHRLKSESFKKLRPVLQNKNRIKKIFPHIKEGHKALGTYIYTLHYDDAIGIINAHKHINIHLLIPSIVYYHVLSQTGRKSKAREIYKTIKYNTTSQHRKELEYYMKLISKA